MTPDLLHHNLFCVKTEGAAKPSDMTHFQPYCISLSSPESLMYHKNYSDRQTGKKIGPRQLKCLFARQTKTTDVDMNKTRAICTELLRRIWENIVPSLCMAELNRNIQFVTNFATYRIFSVLILILLTWGRNSRLRHKCHNLRKNVLAFCKVEQNTNIQSVTSFVSWPLQF